MKPAAVVTPELHLQTVFVLNENGRIVSTREPQSVHGPLFALVRGPSSTAWAVRDDVPSEIAQPIASLAHEEPPTADLRTPPVHAERYIALLSRLAAAKVQGPELAQTSGPAFSFPDALASPEGVVIIDREEPLSHHFSGWVPGEIAAGCHPVHAVIEGGHPVAVCFSARRSSIAAEAGVNTAEAHRRKGHAARVTASWAQAIRTGGLIPLYSTAWTNHASLGVARKLNLQPYASTWSLRE